MKKILLKDGDDLEGDIYDSIIVATGSVKLNLVNANLRNCVLEATLRGNNMYMELYNTKVDLTLADCEAPSILIGESSHVNYLKISQYVKDASINVSCPVAAASLSGDGDIYFGQDIDDLYIGPTCDMMVEFGLNSKVQSLRGGMIFSFDPRGYNLYVLRMVDHILYSAGCQLFQKAEDAIQHWQIPKARRPLYVGKMYVNLITLIDQYIKDGGWDNDK